MPKFVWCEDELNALDEEIVKRVFLCLSPSSARVVTNMSKMLLWPSRWLSGRVSETAKKIYYELNRWYSGDELIRGNCEDMSITINVNGCCEDGGAGVCKPLTAGDGGGMLVDDGGGRRVLVPQRFASEPVALVDGDCSVGYALWEYGEKLIDMVSTLSSVGWSVAIAATVAVAILSEAWIIMLISTGISASSMAIALSRLVSSVEVHATDYWQQNKDDIICTLSGKMLLSAQDAANYFVDQVQESLDIDSGASVAILEFLSGSGVKEILQQHGDGLVIVPENMPANYDCCAEAAVVCPSALVVNSAQNLTHDASMVDNCTWHANSAVLRVDITATSNLNNGNNVGFIRVAVVKQNLLHGDWQVRFTGFTGYISADTDAHAFNNAGTVVQAEHVSEGVWRNMSNNSDIGHAQVIIRVPTGTEVAGYVEFDFYGKAVL